MHTKLVHPILRHVRHLRGLFLGSVHESTHAMTLRHSSVQGHPEGGFKGQTPSFFVEKPILVVCRDFFFLPKKVHDVKKKSWIRPW